MRILFISTYYPSDPHRMVHGVFNRMRMFIDAMKEIAGLDILFFVPPETSVSQSDIMTMQSSFSELWNADIRLHLTSAQEISRGRALKDLFTKYIASIFCYCEQSLFFGTSGNRQLEAFESCLEQKPDALFIHRLASASPVLRTQKSLPPVFFDLDDIEHIAHRRSISKLKKWYSKTIRYSQLPALLSGELKLVRLARKTFVCSEHDRAYMTRRLCQEGVVTVPNSVTIPEEQPLQSDRTLLFLGSFKFQPNINAADFLLKDIWPRITEKVQDARLIIAGAYPENIPGYDQRMNGVTFTGFVENLNELYQGSRVVCAPIFSGAGTRVKIIEAAAYGKPIISTTLGAEGLEMNNGVELLLRDNAEDFSDACIQLLTDDSLCRQLSAAARQKAVVKYDRNSIIKAIQQQISATMNTEENHNRR